MSSLDSAVDIIQGMKGTLKVFPLDAETREGILKVERCIKSQMGMEVKNEGVEQCMQRKHVLCILKNGAFRPPPEATVLLIADDGKIVGTEVIPGEKEKYSKDDDSLMWLCEDFVIFMNVKPEKKEFFYMPPVSFPELNDISGISDVVSCSPSPLGDLVVKNRYGIEDDPKNATIFVGFNASD
ncbi:MAG: hypothetical protein LLG16_04280 [Euryarchaeota archaeon]|nr:hypothetical protein [Euryarchaeota archaeon]